MHYSYAQHDYVNDVCNVCGASNHQHNFNRYIVDPSDVDRHYAICECGVRSEYDLSQEHTFDDGSDICSLCGAAKHTHNWQFTGAKNNDYHWMQCSECKQIANFNHTGAFGNPCSVCGFRSGHGHDWIVVSQGNGNAHIVKCAICKYVQYEAHSEVEGSNICPDCGGVRHIHNGVFDVNWGCGIDGANHQLYCHECGDYIWEEHEYGEDDICDVCGYIKQDD